MSQRVYYIGVDEKEAWEMSQWGDSEILFFPDKFHSAINMYVFSYTLISFLFRMDKLHMALTELCFAINYCSTINVWEYTFAPREYLTQHLENRFARALVGMVMFNSDTNEIAKPSELLASVRAYMNVLQTVENYGIYSETDV